MIVAATIARLGLCIYMHIRTASSNPYLAAIPPLPIRILNRLSFAYRICAEL